MAAPSKRIEQTNAVIVELNRTAIDPREIDLSIFGVVVPALYAPNLGREVVFAAVESTEGLLAAETDFPIGLALALGVLDPAPVRDAVAGLEELAVSEGVPLVVEDAAGKEG